MIPKKVKIGCYTYDIKQTKEPLVHDDKVCYGQIDFHDNTITLHNSYGKQTIEQTFWHEIVHGMCHERGISSEDEVVVDAIATAIYAFLKDNKGKLPGQE